MLVFFKKHTELAITFEACVFDVTVSSGSCEKSPHPTKGLTAGGTWGNTVCLQ